MVTIHPVDYDEVIETPALVVGAGAAGLVTALQAAPLGVAVITKATLHQGASSLWAQGGIAAAVGGGDSPKMHAEDTLAAGAGLSDPSAAKRLTDAGAAAVELLTRLGMRFDLDAHGRFQLSREAAHQRPRVLHANHDATGAELMRALATAVTRDTRIAVFEHTAARELVLDANGSVAGLAAIRDGKSVLFRAPRLVIATGGIGQLYRYTTNPPEATADGVAMAARAGIRCSDLEFVQFHPTALLSGQDPLPLVSEAVRGDGAFLIDESGSKFMQDLHPLGDLAPRDVVARAVWSQMAAGHRVLLDARRVFSDPKKFPLVANLCRSAGLDPAEELIPVVPAAHFHMGGIDVDQEGRSSIRGVWACGEASSTGVHGANRLASNSLLEAVVFGGHVGSSMLASETSDASELLCCESAASMAGRHRTELGADLRNELRMTMWDRVGLVRDSEGLNAAIAELGDGVEVGYEEQNRRIVGRMIARSALERRESRGAHYRSDFPSEDKNLRRHSVTRFDHGSNEIHVEFETSLEQVAV